MRLVKFSEGVLEACWLLALVLAPLFFNTYSSRVFEPDKIALVRSLALVTLAAWLTRSLALAGKRPQTQGWSGWWRVPLAVPVLAFAAVYAIATLFSLAPLAMIATVWPRTSALPSSKAASEAAPEGSSTNFSRWNANFIARSTAPFDTANTRSKRSRAIA